MDLGQTFTIFAIVAANLGTVLGLYFQMDKKLDGHRKETLDILRGIHEEMKDFHGRMCAIEERGRNVKSETK